MARIRIFQRQRPEANSIKVEGILEFLYARDLLGHGTHCACTAGGSFVNNVNRSGLALGTVCGGAPQARLAMYKVGWIFGDISSIDVLKAFDEAIHDGVDVLSLSLGYDLPLFLKLIRVM
ncbi:Subtilase family protein [Forsythia ovata]|uniref:Subtilase family protein n=1 Tax=Forsythia ovata TaxID=205694 RepID=A0ABD1XAL0_9LAMI